MAPNHFCSFSVHPVSHSNKFIDHKIWIFLILPPYTGELLTLTKQRELNHNFVATPDLADYCADSTEVNLQLWYGTPEPKRCGEGKFWKLTGYFTVIGLCRFSLFIIVSQQRTVKVGVKVGFAVRYCKVLLSRFIFWLLYLNREEHI